MLTQEPMSGRDRAPEPARRVTPAMAAVLTAVVLIVVALRHDYWNWDTPKPLLFGFMPVGLWWQGIVTILASAMMWLLVRFAWPGHLEEEAIEAERRRLEQTGQVGTATDERPQRH